MKRLRQGCTEQVGACRRAWIVMPERRDPPSGNLVLIAEIQRAFRDVERGKGVTLHETEVIDNYGSGEERRKARAIDTDRNWQEVEDRWIEEFGGVCGLSFLDDEGFRYCLPAYMIYWLRTGNEPNSLAFHLQESRLDLYSLLRPWQKHVTAKFLNYARMTFASRDAAKALEKYWHQYLDCSDEV